MGNFALVIAQQSVHLYRLHGAQAEPVATAHAQDDPVAWVAEHVPMGAVCSLVSDIMDESYTRNELPPIWMGATRQQLLARRLTQQLRDNPYRAAVLEPSGSFRPPTRVSLIGMGQGDRIDHWLAAFTAHRVRVKGLWPLSALIALSVNHKAPRRAATGASPGNEKAPNVPVAARPVLALVATPAGLRQVLVRGKMPLFSRLALSIGESSFSAAYVLSEARRTVQYLISQEWIGSADQPLATQMWLPSEDEEALVAASNDPALDLQFIHAVPDAYAFLLPRLKSAPAQLQFLPDESRKQWRAAQLASSARIAGVTALLVAVVWSGDLMWSSWKKRSLGQEQLVRAEAINRQARQEVLQAKGDLTEAGLAVATVQAWQQTLAVQPDQFAGLQHLATALSRAPNVEIKRMFWELPRLPVQEEGAPPPVPEPFACPAAKEVVADPSGAAPEPAKSSVARLRVNAELPSTLPLRQALALQDGLISALSSGGWSAVLLKSSIVLDPVQVQSGTLGLVGMRSFEFCMQKAPA